MHQHSSACRYEFLVASVIKCVNVPSDETCEIPGNDSTFVDYSRLDSLPRDKIQSMSRWLVKTVAGLRFDVLWDKVSIIEVWPFYPTIISNGFGLT